MSFPVKEDGTLGTGTVFFRRHNPVGKAKGPAGRSGRWIARQCLERPGQAACWVFTPEGTHLGRSRLGEATGNCAWGNTAAVLYITADMYLLRIRTSTTGNNPLTPPHNQTPTRPRQKTHGRVRLPSSRIFHSSASISSEPDPAFARK